MGINTYEQFYNLRGLDLNDLEPGDILLTKHFLGNTKVTVGQKFYMGGDYQGSRRNIHAAIILSKDYLAHAVGGGGICKEPIRNWDISRRIVYTCTNQELRNAALIIAIRLASFGGDYAGWGAFKSAFRSHGNQNDNLQNRPLPPSTERYLREVIGYCEGANQIRPKMFCSEFVTTCYEAGSLWKLGKTAFRSNPNAVTPSDLEHILNIHPQDFWLKGYLELRANILFHAIKEAINDYDKSLGGLKGFFGLRRPSDESTKARKFLYDIISPQTVNLKFLEIAVRHYMHLDQKGTTPEDFKLYDKVRNESKLNQKSTFYKIIIEKMRENRL